MLHGNTKPAAAIDLAWPARPRASFEVRRPPHDLRMALHPDHLTDPT
jgi:hypothetical protein